MEDNLIQKEWYNVNKDLSVDIEIYQQKEHTFLFKYRNRLIPTDTFQICFDKDLLFNLIKAFDKKSSKIIAIEELQMNYLSFDFLRGNTLYFNIEFENIINNKVFHSRINVFFQKNNHGNQGEIYSFDRIYNEIC